MSVPAIAGEKLLAGGFGMEPDAVDRMLVVIQDVLAVGGVAVDDADGAVGEADLADGLVGGHGLGWLGLRGTVLVGFRPTPRGEGGEAGDNYRKKNGRLHPEDPVQRLPAS